MSTPNDPESVVDMEAALSFAADDPELLMVVAESFVEVAPQQFIDIGNAVKDKDFDAIAAAAHTLKGSVIVFGGEMATKVLIDMESGAKEKDIARVVELEPELDREFHRLLSEVERIAT